MKTFPHNLLRGYRSFMDGRYAEQKQRYRQLAEKGQSPETLLIACCDSRVAPEIIFDAGPGELFVVRNVANLVPPYQPDGERFGTSAAIEFAVAGLHVRNIVVMGHGRCGGIQAALAAAGNNDPPTGFVGRWMDQLTPDAKATRSDEALSKEERQTALERISIRRSIENLRTFPYIGKRETAGDLDLHGAWFDVAAGDLWIMDKTSGEFRKPD